MTLTYEQLRNSICEIEGGSLNDLQASIREIKGQIESLRTGIMRDDIISACSMKSQNTEQERISPTGVVRDLSDLYEMINENTENQIHFLSDTMAQLLEKQTLHFKIWRVIRMLPKADQEILINYARFNRAEAIRNLEAIGILLGRTAFDKKTGQLMENLMKEIEAA